MLAFKNLDTLVKFYVSVKMLAVVEPGATHTDIQSDNQESFLVIFAAAKEEPVNKVGSNFRKNVRIGEYCKIKIIERIANNWHRIDNANLRIALLVWYEQEVVSAKIAMHEILLGIIAASNFERFHDFVGRNGADVATCIFNLVQQESAPAGVLFIQKAVAGMRIFLVAAHNGVNLLNGNLRRYSCTIKFNTINKFKTLVTERLATAKQLLEGRAVGDFQELGLGTNSIEIGDFYEVLAIEAKDGGIRSAISIELGHDASKVDIKLAADIPYYIIYLGLVELLHYLYYSKKRYNVIMVKEAQKQDRSWIVWMAIVVTAVVAAVGIAIWLQHQEIMKRVDSSFAKTTESDVSGHERFAEAYPQLTAENVFVYRNSREIQEILQKGSGIVFLCDPANTWCQHYAPLLNETTKSKEVNKIFYYNTPGGLKKSPADYKKIAEIINSAQSNESDVINVPCTVFVLNGKIIAIDTETAVDMSGDADPKDYWTPEHVEDFSNRISGYIDSINAK